MFLSVHVNSSLVFRMIALYIKQPRAGRCGGWNLWWLFVFVVFGEIALVACAAFAVGVACAEWAAAVLAAGS